MMTMRRRANNNQNNNTAAKDIIQRNKGAFKQPLAAALYNFEKKRGSSSFA